ncbi:MAG: PKD domain-containing protein [Bacteroidia bacterium]|nr:PKD domain-containing protein [Bacteroidia bacterium]
MRRLFVIGIILMLLPAGIVFAQSSWECGTHTIYKKQLDSDRQMIIDQANLEEFTRAFAQNYKEEHQRSGVNYVMPIVFHIIHTYGSDNIEKLRVLEEVQNINDEFQKLVADSNNVAAMFRPIHADCEIEFRLAKIDPNGDCTNGITRTFSNLTLNAGENVKTLVKWPSDKYVNVWVVANIPGGTAAYAYLPTSGNVADHGVLCEATWIGNAIGSPTRVMAHELGHHLNLHHTWGGTNGPGTPGNCSDDDWVNDTPNCIGGFSCNPNGNTCSTLDNVHNIMDYTSCPIMFTEGQKVRMHAALNSGTGARNNLWTNANRVATGTDDNYVPVACAPIADFDDDFIRTCTGVPVTFKDGSWKGDPTNWTWTLPGATPSVSNDQNPVVVYNTPGTYDVTLTASNAGGSDTKTRSQIVEVRRAAAWYGIPFAESFENIAFPGGFWSVVNPGGKAWEIDNTVSYTGSKCLRLINYSGNTNQPDEFITPSYNLSNVSGTELTFKLAYGVRSTNSLEQLKVYYSTDCGKTWSIRYTKSGVALATAGIVSSPFVPAGPNQWREETVNLASSSISGHDNVIFKFEFTSDNSNNIYIDDINITGVVGISELSEEDISLNIHPNPSEQQVNIDFNIDKPRSGKIFVIDALGRTIDVIFEGDFMPGSNSFNYSEDLSKGLYLINVEIDGVVFSKRYLRN